MLGEVFFGEVEIFVFNSGGELYVLIVFDYIDCKLEVYSVVFFK